MKAVEVSTENTDPKDQVQGEPLPSLAAQNQVPSNEANEGDEDTTFTFLGPPHSRTSRSSDDHDKAVQAAGLATDCMFKGDVCIRKTDNSVCMVANPDDIKPIVFRDEFTLIEKMGCETCGHWSLVVVYVLYMLSTVVSFAVEPMALLVISGLWKPVHKEVILILFAIRHSIGIAMNIINFMTSYTSTAVKFVLKANAFSVVWIGGTRIAYTIASAIYFPDVYNTIAVVDTFFEAVFMLLLDALIINNSQRMTIAGFEKHFSISTKKSCPVPLIATIIGLIFDVLRHLAVLYRVASEEDPQKEAAVFISMSISQRAFTVPVKSVMTSCFAASVVLTFNIVLQYMRFGGIGSVVQSKRIPLHFKNC
mmetsp:Transcript_50668/g.99239  ORF Transcript_50668/g.99239 Transcript_50668/m.99239 type:complete len:365 (-) Transcript_50668:158-1252(-)